MIYCGHFCVERPPNQLQPGDQITMINMSYCPLIMNYRPAVVIIVLRVNQRDFFHSRVCVTRVYIQFQTI